MKTGLYPEKNCPVCGRKLKLAPARYDGEPTFVGYLPCKCERINKL